MWKHWYEAIKAWLTRERAARLVWYGALTALLVILGTASYAYRTKYDRPQDAVPAPTPAAAMAVGTPMPLEDLFTLPTPSPEPTPEPVVFEWPLEGEIIGEYAPDALAWSETMGQWQSHNGIDIAAAAGEAVAACADGTVLETWEDPLWGYVIEIGHREGYVSAYANLSTLNLVKPGEEVAAGQIISAVGSTAACESEMPWHLHFELKKNDNSVDFEKIVGKGLR